MMITFLETVADRALALLVPKAEADAAGNCGSCPSAWSGCDPWTCCLIGPNPFYYRACRDIHNRCYSEWGGKC